LAHLAYVLFSVTSFPLLEDKIKTNTATTILAAIANRTQLGKEFANRTQLGKEYVEWNGHEDKLALLFKEKIGV
jgi:hypothetical protein